MSTFQSEIEEWISRRVQPRAITQCFDLPIVLSTDIGLERTENQDRVAALRIGTGSMGRPLLAVAVADGMGGMRDGARCASIAISSFFDSLIRLRSCEYVQRISQAIDQANRSVFSFAEGRGGSTLSAVVISESLPPTLVHVGDSRVYSFDRTGKLDRLTVDDSLAEAVGGHGRELLQFVGMGAEMKPYIGTISPEHRFIAITTDGIHFIDPDIFEKIISNSPDLKSASERLAALARWFGGHDNASSALFDLRPLIDDLRKKTNSIAQISDPFSTLALAWAKDDREISSKHEQGSEALDAEKVKDDQRAAISTGRSKSAKKANKRKKTSKKSKPKEKVQLEIHIEGSDSSEGEDADR